MLFYMDNSPAFKVLTLIENNETTKVLKYAPGNSQYISGTPYKLLDYENWLPLDTLSIAIAIPII